MRDQLPRRTDLRESEMRLGAMVCGDRRKGGARRPEEAAAIGRRFADSSGNFIDMEMTESRSSIGG
jgi:aryl-alcohol dehydrogenase-like predicted oxidoreductase